VKNEPTKPFRTSRPPHNRERRPFNNDKRFRGPRREEPAKVSQPAEPKLVLPAGHNKIVLTCPKGIAPYLKDEVAALGFPVIGTAEATVDTHGTLDDTMKLNLHLRTAHRVLFLLKEFEAHHPDKLYREVVELPWENYLKENGYFSVHSAVSTDALKDPRFGTLRCKDAIVDRIRNKCGRRPDSGSEPTGAAVFLHWQDNRAAVYLDTSGEPLSRRGYRKDPFKAPMQETLAAATILATTWNKSEIFINPMCGSGTLAIEAALMALRRAPGLSRDNFGFMHLKTFNKIKWNALTKEAWRDARSTIDTKIVATDIDPEAIIAAKKNARDAGVEHAIVFETCDFRQTPVPPGGPGVLFFNPEYGERLGSEAELEPIYQAIGDFLKKSCVGYRGYVFTGNLNLAKKVGLRSNRRITFFNSNLECRLLEFEMYEGTQQHRLNEA
jgi:23S rRNA G2445 N2-methylase RlmL